MPTMGMANSATPALGAPYAARHTSMQICSTCGWTRRQVDQGEWMGGGPGRQVDRWTGGGGGRGPEVSGLVTAPVGGRCKAPL